MVTEKIIDMLTKDSVSIITKKFIEDNGEKLQVGKIHRRAYANSMTGRNAIISNEPEDISSTVLAYWGKEPTIFEKNEEIIEGNN